MEAVIQNEHGRNPSIENTHVENPEDTVDCEEPAAPAKNASADGSRELRVRLPLLKRLEIARHLILEGF